MESGVATSQKKPKSVANDKARIQAFRHFAKPGFVDEISTKFEDLASASAAEAAGDLEDALARATERRQSALDRRSHWLMVTAIAVMTAGVFVYVGVIVIRFYSAYFATLDALR